MKRLGLYLLAAIVVLFLLAYTSTYTIRFTEAGVKTTLGKADASSVKSTPGLGFKLPSPVETVTTYDIRPRISQVKLETQQTKDSRQIVVESYCVWKVTDPLKFFQRFNSAGSRTADQFKLADETVKSNLRSAMGAVSRYEMGQLFSGDPKADGLGALEKDILLALKTSGTAAGEITLATMGLEVMDVGISQVSLPQETTNKVFERMAAVQERKAKEISAQADSRATSIRTRAEQDAKRIEAFAKQLAAEIMRKGDEEAKPFYDQMKSNPRLAQFLIECQMLKEVYGKQETQLVIPVNFPGLRLLKPDAVNEVLKNGQIQPANAGGVK